MDKKILAAIAVLLIAALAVGFAVFQNIESLKNRNLTATLAARQAIEQHDLETFKKYVDTDALINQAAAEILAAHINSTLSPTNYSTAALQQRYDELKPDFVQTARAALDEYITTGKVTFPATLTDAQKFLQKTGVDSCEIKSITKPHLEGDEQTSTVIIFNPTMNFNFELELELEHDNAGNWRITRATGFENYYYGYRRALRRKLNSLNIPIVRQLDEIFKLKSFRAKASDGDEYGFSSTLEIALNADVHFDKPLAQVVGNIIIGKGDREHYSPFVIDMTGAAQGEQSFTVTKTLNPFVRADADVMKHGLKAKQLRIEITEIIFADGTKLKQLDQLPD